MDTISRTKISPARAGGRDRGLARSAAVFAAQAVTGLLLARANIFGGLMSPFGAAYIAAAGRGTTAAALLGVIAGYVIPGGCDDLLRYIATALAVAGIKWALAEMGRVSRHPAFPPAAAFSGIILTGAVVTTSVGALLSFDLLIYLAEGLLAAAGAYFFTGGLSVLDPARRTPVTLQEACCVIVTVCAASITLCRVSVGGFSPGAAAVLLAALVSARLYGTLGGAVAGISAGTVIALASGDYTLAGATAAAGLMAGLFEPVGNVASAAAFSVTCVMGTLGSGSVNVFFAAEGLLASAVMPAIRSSWLDRLPAVIRPKSSAAAAESASGEVSAKLSDAAQALSGVSETMEQVADKLDRLTAISPESVCRAAARQVCEGCSISSHCWGEAKEETESAFDSASVTLRSEGRLTRANSPELIGKRCARSGELTDRINELYADFAARESARRRLRQVRSVVADQLGGVGALLSELAGETCALERTDPELCGLVAQAVQDSGYVTDAVSCRTGANGGLSVTLSVSGRDKKAAPRSELCDIVSEVLGADMTETGLRRAGEGFTMTMEQEPPLTVRYGAAQHCCCGERLCGDSYDLFVKNGKVHMILSDGMGSGGRAAVDSAMTCGLLGRLLRAGFSHEGALRMVNASLLVKSEDESLSTADCAGIDLFTGETALCKAGAAPAFLLHGGAARQISADSLPLGILRTTELWSGVVTLEEGDVLVMLSDGAAETGTDWIAEELEGYSGDDPRALAKDIVALAAARRGKDNDDDITVIAAQIEYEKYKNETKETQ